MPKRRKSAEGLSLSELRRLKKKKKRTRKRATVTIFLLFATFIGILFTPLFNLSEITVVGNSRLTGEEIISTGGFEINKNIFSFNLNKAGESLSKIPYINSVLIERKLPSKIEITITESIPMAYVLCSDFYLVIDKSGKALEAITGDMNYDIPTLLDFQITEFVPGEKIITNNEEKFQKTLEIIRDLYNNSFMDKVKSVTFSGNDIILNITESLKINMGDYEQFNSKIIMIKEVLLKLPKNASGTINAVNANKVYYSSVY